ncbi:hypothetical protein [Pseudomonas syringae]|uniref:hypothetical protein n=1 Tax=Pseudomonas syringae TaxID=317 RepID=UPI000464F364|nr:hypothetical protein [Pseudomonas syringae]QGG77089.1 hypothetical protein N028_17660 [Pseudomonas syringae USA011]
MHAIDPQEALVPIFVESRDSGRIQQVGTGIFLELQEKPFLFTAAHVTDTMHSGQLMVPNSDGLVEIEGYMACVDLPPEENREDDPIDIAYYRLSTNFAKSMLAHFKPLPQSRCEIIRSALDLGICSIYGYPVSKARQNGDHFSSETASYRGVVAEERTYQELGLFADSSIVVHFKKKNAISSESGKKINPLSPRGVSGGGIFAWPESHELSNDWSLTRLVGIFHTYKESKGLMIGTHLAPLIAAIQLGQMKDFGGIE